MLLCKKRELALNQGKHDILCTLVHREKHITSPMPKQYYQCSDINQPCGPECIITAVCQETHIFCAPHTLVVYGNLKFPQTRVLLDGTNQFHLKLNKSYHFKRLFLPAPPPLSLRKIIYSRRAPDQNALLQPETISTHKHYSELRQKGRKKTKQNK